MAACVTEEDSCVILSGASQGPFRDSLINESWFASLRQKRRPVASSKTGHLGYRHGGFHTFFIFQRDRKADKLFLQVARGK